MINLEHILIVEDNAVETFGLKGFLEKSSYRVTSAGNGQDALEAIRENTPDLILSDVMMPVMDGFQLCESVKTDNETAEIPVLPLTQLSSPTDIIHGLRAGADSFLPKPFEPQDLLTRIQYLLVNRRLRHNHQSGMCLDVFFDGQKHQITAERQQILDLLLSAYGTAYSKQIELIKTQDELRLLNAELELKVLTQTAQLRTEIEEKLKVQDEKENLIVELERRNAELTQFSYALSHDLKSPLTTIMGFMGFLKKDLQQGDTERVERDIMQVNLAAQKMKQLLSDMLNLVRIGTLPSFKEEISSGDLLTHALGLVAAQIVAKNVVVEMDDDLPTVFGERFRLLEVLQNLLDNAVKFSSSTDPKIRVGCLQKKNEWEFYVEDNGIGIAPDVLEKIFGLFERGETDYDGTGIGLALAKKTIDDHRGRIWAESKGKGCGTTFRFTLPHS